MGSTYGDCFIEETILKRREVDLYVPDVKALLSTIEKFSERDHNDPKRDENLLSNLRGSNPSGTWYSMTKSEEVELWTTRSGMTIEELNRLGVFTLGLTLAFGLFCVPFAALYAFGFNDLHGIITIRDGLLVMASLSLGGLAMLFLIHYKLSALERITPVVLERKQS
jgi:hypothetical protein